MPVFLLIGLFLAYPILYVFSMSFFSTNKLGTLVAFSGFKEYLSVFTSAQTWIVTGRTVLWTILAVTIKVFFGLVIAVLLNTSFPFRTLSRVLFILPWASSIPISVMLWKWAFHHEFGLLNHLLQSTGIFTNPPVWLGNPITAFISTVWVDSWLGIPFMAVMFLAGMQAISASLYEAAAIDGANVMQKFFYVTIPGIRGILFIAIMLSSLWTFSDFNTPYILTKGGPAGTTDILITYIYKNGFEYLKWSRAAVLSVMTFLILSVISTINAKLYFGKAEL